MSVKKNLVKATSATTGTGTLTLSAMTGHLPAMPSPAEWEASGKRMALGDIQQRLWETVEVQAVHIDKLLARIETLEARVTALGG